MLAGSGHVPLTWTWPRLAAAMTPRLQWAESDVSELPLWADKPGCPSVLHACRPCLVAAQSEAGAAEEERRREERRGGHGSSSCCSPEPNSGKQRGLPSES